MNGKSGFLVILLLAVVGGGLGWLMLRTGDNDEPVDNPSGTSSSSSTAELTDKSGGEESAPTSSIKTEKFSEESENTASATQVGSSDGPTLQGRVTAPDGSGVAKVRLTLFQDVSAVKSRAQEGDQMAEVYSNKTGYFAIKGLPLDDLFVLRAQHPDYVAVRRHPISASDSSTLVQNIKMQAGEAIAGSVTDFSDVPLTEAKISVFDMSVASLNPESEPERVATSGPDGTFRVKNLSAGMKRILVEKEGYSTDGRNAFHLQAKAKPRALKFRLSQGSSMSGVVVSKRTGEPIEGALIRARPVSFMAKAGAGSRSPFAPRRPSPATIDTTGGDGPGDISERATIPRGQGMQARPGSMAGKSFLTAVAKSDAQGRFKLTGLMSARYLLTIHCAGFQTSNGQTGAAGDTGVRIEMVPSARALGRVVDVESGLPVKNFTIAAANSPTPMYIPAQTKQSFSDENGEFTYVDLRPGRHFLIASAPGYAGGRTESLTISPEQEVTGIEIKLIRGATLKGSVRSAVDGPIANAVVKLASARLAEQNNPFAMVFRTQMRTAASLQTRTNKDGAWTLSNVMNGDYKVEVLHDNYTDGKSEVISVPDRGELNVEPISLIRGGIIKGMVKNKEGNPDTKATVAVSNIDPKRMFTRTVVTTSSGTYKLAGLEPGTYRVSVTQRDGVINLADLLKNRGQQGQLVTVGDGSVETINF